MHSLYQWCRFSFLMEEKKKRHKQLSNEILKPSGFKGKSRTNFNTCSGCPMGIRNSSDFPSTLPRPVRKLTLNHGDIENGEDVKNSLPTKPVLCPAILTLPSGGGM